MCVCVSMSQKICPAIEFFEANITNVSSFLSFAFSFVEQQRILPVSFIATAITSQPIVFIVTALIMFKPTFPVLELLVGFSTKENFLLIHDLKNLNLNNLKNVAVL